MRRTAIGLIGSLLVVTTSNAQQVVQWQVKDGGNGHWYTADTAYRRWAVAQSRASARGGHLATPTSAAENAFVVSVRAMVGVDRPWLGGFQDRSAPDYSEPAGGWRWVTGETWAYTAWAAIEPNNQGNEDWLHFGDNAGAWNDLPASNQWPAMIEWSADCNADGVVDYGQVAAGVFADTNGNGVPDCCDHGTPCTPNMSPVEWRTQDGGNGHWYEAVSVPGGIGWTAARDAAARAGGHLATFETAAEFDALSPWVTSRPTLWWHHANWWGGPWIGAYQDRADPTYSEPNGGWKWVTDTGIPMSFLSAYGMGNPNDYPCCEDYLQFGEGFCTPMINDVPEGSFTISYLVEYESDCNGDGIVDLGQVLSGALADGNHNRVPDACECASDFNQDGRVDGSDLGNLFVRWNTTQADLDGDGTTNGADLSVLLANWGPCGG